MSTKFLSPGWRMPRNANQSKSSNYSLDFNGSSRIDCGNGIQIFTQSHSYSFWVKKPTISEGYIFGYGIDSVIIFFGDGRIRFYTGGLTSGTDFYSSTSLSTNTWYHICCTYEKNGDKKIYIDGSLDNTISTSGTIQTGGVGLTIAARNLAGSISHYFTGQLDGMCLFNYALSASQVTTLWGGGTSVSNPMTLPSPPVAYYPLGTSAWNGEYLSENNAIGDYVFDFIPSDYIDCGTGLGNTLGSSVSDMTVSLWYKNQTGSNEGLFTIMSSITSETTAPFAISYSNTNNSTYVWFGSTDYNYYSRTLDSNWHHLSIVKNGTSLTTYIDGSSVSPSGTVGSIPATIDTTNKKTFIGVYYSDSFTYNGSLSNAQVFNTALSSTDIETLYNYGSPIRTLANIPQSSNLKAWYKLDATEIYNSTSTEWEIDNNANPSVYTQSTKLNGNNNSRIFLNPNTGGSTGGFVLPNSFSFSFWINTTSTASGFANSGGVIEASGGSTSSGGPMWNMFRYNNFTNGKWSIFLNSTFQGGTNGNVEVTPVINDGKWHHILLTYDSTSTTMTVHTDNVQTYTLSTNNFGIGINVARIGTSYDSNSTMTGNLSNLSFWTDVLTSSQINEIYNNGTPKDLSTNSNYSNLLHWYKLSTDFQDTKGSNDGTGGSTTTKTFSFINTLAGNSTGMSQSNLVQSDLQTVAPYSKYAMNFDAGNADYIDLTSQIVLTSELTISCWVKSDGAVIYGIVAADNGSADSFYRFYPAAPGGNRVDITVDGTSTEWNFANGGTPIQNGVWQHYLLKRDSNNKWTFYLDNVKYTTNQPTISGSFRVDTFCRIYSTSPRYFEGAMSNMAIWNTSLSDSQVREVYNQGLPSDLNSFSGTAPIHWWQLGEGSSYAGGWIFADEIGSINGEGQNIAETDLTNGVGTTANGVSTNMAEGNLVGDAPYSTTNAVSVNMAATARGTSVP